MAARVDARPAPAGAHTSSGALSEDFALDEVRAVFARLSHLTAAVTAPRVASFSVSAPQWQVNASTRCSPATAAIEVTRGPVSLAANLAAARALDERSGSDVLDEYSNALAHLLRRGGVVVGPMLAGLPSQVANDPWKLARQRRLFVDIVTFIAAHEIGHAASGHARCTTNNDSGVRQR